MPAIQIGRSTGVNNCLSYFTKGIPEGMDFDKLAVDLAVRGYRMGKVRFRDNTGTALADPPERNVGDTRQQWKNCFDAQGGKKGAAVLVAGGNAGTHVFAELVTGQLDDVFRDGYQAYYGSTAIE